MNLNYGIPPPLSLKESFLHWHLRVELVIRKSRKSTFEMLDVVRSATIKFSPINVEKILSASKMVFEVTSLKQWNHSQKYNCWPFLIRSFIQGAINEWEEVVDFWISAEKIQNAADRDQFGSLLGFLSNHLWQSLNGKPTSYAVSDYLTMHRIQCMLSFLHPHIYLLQSLHL